MVDKLVCQSIAHVLDRTVNGSDESCDMVCLQVYAAIDVMVCVQWRKVVTMRPSACVHVGP